MFWRICAAAVTAMMVSACGFAGAEPAPLRPQPWTPAPQVSAEVTDPAPIVRGTMRPYQIRGRWYTPEVNEAFDETGVASWYGDAFHGRPTATGEIFDMHALTAAHRTLPMSAEVHVHNPANGRSVTVRINDRGPLHRGRMIDLSRAAALALGVLDGPAVVEMRHLAPAAGSSRAGTATPAAGDGEAPD